MLVLFTILAPPSMAQEVDYSDTTPPRIESLTLNPSTVDVSQEGAVLLVTVVGSDDRNTITLADGYLDPLFGANPQSFTNSQLSVKKVGSRIETTLQLKFVFKKGTPLGIYRVRVSLFDAADNRLVAANFISPSNLLTVVNSNSSRTIDVSEFDFNAKLDSYALQLKNLTSEVSSLKSQLSASDNEKGSLQSKLSNLITEKSGLQTQINNLITEKSGLQTQINNLITEKSGLQKRLNSICKVKPKPKGC
jgi:chaperonin cofactor prefoldin